jgi:nucleotide-binding universal stress UspA family protein
MVNFRNILVATDFSGASARALALAIELVAKFEASLALVHVYEIPVYAYPEMGFAPLDLLAPIEETARGELNNALISVKQKVPKATATLRRGVPWREILSAIDETHADLIILGTHGRRGLSHALLGSVAEKVLRLSPVPVLTVRDAR